MDSVAATLPPRLLLVEDDGELASMLVSMLRLEGFRTDVAGDGQRGLHLGLTRSYDVMVIDRGLPAIDGVSLVRRLREQAVTARALLLTSMSSLTDRIEGLDAGADDYLTKPFEVGELAARLRALCRRPLEQARELPVGAAHLDLTTQVATLRSGRTVELSGRECALLRELAVRPGSVRSRDELRRRVFEDAPSASIVDTYVYYLRRKLGRTAIRTVRGVGYQIGRG